MSPSGTTINLFDYWVSDNSTDGNSAKVTYNSDINANHALRFGGGGDEKSGTDCNGWTGSAKVFSGIVKNKLEDGYPVVGSDNSYGNAESLSYLLDSSVFEGKTVYENVSGLLY